MKSFQVPTAAKIATTVRAGRVAGKTIRQAIDQSLAPSTRAASSMSRGVCSMNCRSRKVKNPPANSAGRIRGAQVLTKPSAAHMSNIGISVTGNGRNSVASTTKNTLSRPGQSMHENP